MTGIPLFLLLVVFYSTGLLMGRSMRQQRAEEDLWEAQRLRDEAWDMRHLR